MHRKTIFAVCAALALSLTGTRAAEAAGISQHDGLTWADVTVNGRILHFVVDTGATSSCINLAAARRIGMPLGSPVSIAGVGGEATGYRCENFQASVGGMALPAQVLALDLSGPARSCSEPIDGLIGADFFRGKVVRLDFAKGLLSREERLPAGGGTPLRFANGAICVPVSVDGGDARWTRLDTGCTDALDWCGCGNDRSPGARAGHSMALGSSRKLGGSLNKRCSCRNEAQLAEVTVGTTELHAVPVKARAREIFPGEAGLLGNAALSQYRVTIDGIGKRLLLD